MIRFKPQGRLGNVLLQNIGISIISKKFDLKVENYFFEKEFQILGCQFHSGLNTYTEKFKITDYELLSFLSESRVNKCVEYFGYFQIKEFVLNYKEDILSHFNLDHTESFSNDAFVHVRLGDVEDFNPGYNYYYKCLSKLKCENIYISTDSPNNNMVKRLLSDFDLILYQNDPIETLNFARKFNTLILSKGTFSWWIGMLSKAENIFYPINDRPWCGDIFVFEDWQGVTI